MNSPEALATSIQLVTAAEDYGIQGRGPSIVADLVALASVAIGALALARAKERIGTGGGRTGALVAMTVGLTGIVLAGVALAIADGGPGTGNGVVGSVFALAIGLIGVVLGGPGSGPLPPHRPTG
ncbi:DUF6223 family protein [Streptomyces sp. P9-A2]|uniref:DUF6223 family protein n=1 Tax=Streptomyces sp. P9-A2 TaxID=3072284 RepID=UPI002FCC083C